MGNIFSGIANYVIRKSIETAKRNKYVKAALYSNNNRKNFNDLRQHEWMLSCPVRVKTYYNAIRKYVKQGDVVVDLGTGTGVLAFFASQNNPSKIYAIEHGDVINMAQHVAEYNKIENITFVNCHSTEFSPNEKVDVIIQEQIGDYLLDEDMIRNVCDLRDRLLAPKGRILPNLFHLYAEPIALNPGRRIAYLWENNLFGIDFSTVKEYVTEGNHANGRPIVNPLSRLFPGDVSHFLGTPEPVFSFDLLKVDPDNLPTRFSIRRNVEEDGSLDGFCFYFKTVFDDEISFQNHPFEQLTHWGYHIYRTEPIKCKKGEVINFTFEMPEQTKVNTWRIDYEIEKMSHAFA